MAREIEATGKAAAEAKAKVEAKAQADRAAKTAAAEHAESVRQLREEYASLVQNGDLQGAAEKLQQLNKAMAQTSQALTIWLPRCRPPSSAWVSPAVQTWRARPRMPSATIRPSKTRARPPLKTYRLFKKAADDAIATNKGIAHFMGYG